MSDEDFISFSVLYYDGSEFKTKKTKGIIFGVDKSAVVVKTTYALKPGQMLKWADRHKKGNLHFALVKSSRRQGNNYTATLSLL